MNDYQIKQIIKKFKQIQQKYLENKFIKNVNNKLNPYLLFEDENYLNQLSRSKSKSTKIGNYLEELFIEIGTIAFNGRKYCNKNDGPTGSTDFISDSHKILASIKTSSNWGNSDQNKAMINHIEELKNIKPDYNYYLLISQSSSKSLNKTIKLHNNIFYIKKTGSYAWDFISGMHNFYENYFKPLEINQPVSHQLLHG